MIIVKLWGGLGNQMFQYACAAALASDNNMPLKLDVHHFEGTYVDETVRQYALGIFPAIQEPVASVGEIKKYFPFFQAGIVSKIVKKLNRDYCKITPGYIAEQPGGYNRLPAVSKGAYLEGYWQSEKYFAEQAGMIRNRFNLQHLADADSLHGYLQEAAATSVSIHIRRGDYTSGKTLAVHGLAGIDYYTKAIKAVAHKLQGQGNMVFLVFSDDLEWCRQHLQIPYHHLFVETGREDHDLFLMSRCRHNIIANSSFSWWAAWLNGNSGKMVVAPQQWFAKKVNKDIIPSSWIKI